MAARFHVYRTLTSLLLAGGLGLLGVTLAVSDGQHSTALLYTLAGAILWLRPPVPLEVPVDET